MNSTKRTLAAIFLLAGWAAVGLTVVGCGAQSSATPPAQAPTAGAGGGGGGGGGGDGGGGGGGGGDPQPSVVVSADSKTMTASRGAISLTATVETASGGVPPDGTAVTFSASPSLGVTITPAANGTTAGVLTATLVITKAGSFNITATALNVTSSRLAVKAVTPTVTLASEAATVSASRVGSGGVTVTATVTDHLDQPVIGLTNDQVVFSTTTGVVGGFQPLGDGRYQATLTSTATGIAAVRATALGDTSDPVSVEVVSDTLNALVITASPSQVEPNGSSALTIEGEDQFGNPVTLETVDLSAGALGTLSTDSVTLRGEAATATFNAGAVEGVAVVTARCGAVQTQKSIPIAWSLVGEPVNVTVDVTPAGGRLAIAGVGGTERATLTATVTDYAGNPIIDQQGNIEFEILSGPNGGERFLPSDPASLTLFTPAGGTVGGKATATFQSGTKAGTVTLQVRVVKDKNGLPLDQPITATIPNILAVAGQPVNLYLGRSTMMTDPKDGTYIHPYFATVVDENGNGVPGVSVSFGQFSNIVVSAEDGAMVAGGTEFSGSFLASDVHPGDLLAVMTGSNQGGFSITSASADGTLSVLTPFTATQTGLSFLIGNNLGIGGPVISPQAGEPVTDGTGKVVWNNIVPVSLLNYPLLVYAETRSKAVGKAVLFRNGWISPTNIKVLEGWTGGRPGDVLPFRLKLTDSGALPMPIPFCRVTLSVDVPTGDVGLDDGDFNSTGSNRAEIYTDSEGVAEFYWTVPANPGLQHTITMNAGETTIARTLSML